MSALNTPGQDDLQQQNQDPQQQIQVQGSLTADLQPAPNPQQPDGSNLSEGTRKRELSPRPPRRALY